MSGTVCFRTFFVGKGRRKMEISKTRKLTECAVMLALATALSYITVYSLPMGGTVTAFSQVPIIIIGYRHGYKWGLGTGVVYGLLQMLLQGLGNFSYVSGIAAYLILILADYLLAFTALGFGGSLFSRAKKLSAPAAVGIGAAVGSILRFLCHFISGVTIWGDYAGGWKNVWVYSLFYNGSYMLAECIITVVGVTALAFAFDLKAANLRRKKKSA